MKKHIIRAFAPIITSAILLSCGSEPKKVSISDLKTFEDSLSFGIGTQMGMGYKTDTTLKLNTDVLTRAMHQAYTSQDSILSEEEMSAFFQALNQKMQARQEASMAKKAQIEIERGNKFLAENKTKDNVVETASGLQYQVIAEGKGKKPTIENIVSVNYKLRLVDGAEIESTTKDHPAEFPMAKLIPGMQEALMMMSEGAKYQLWIPSNIGYGNRQQGNIPGGAVLCFEMELLKILK